MTAQPDLFNHQAPPRALARARDPQTSHLAAASLDSQLPDLERVVLRAVIKGGALGRTLDETCDETGLDKVTASPRFRPLQRKEHIREAEFTRAGKSGRQQTVWVATVQQA